ncbi:MAG TPA: hypothetical protein VFM46_13995, partial [Pseudomonadales bacterium]|nr:hypothetical protein [Pseudomonadales bacterium]
MDYFLIFFYGLLLASLINYLADVLPLKRTLAAPACAHCQKEFALADYFLLKPCSACAKKRSLRSWVMPLFLSASMLLLWTWPPSNMGFWLSSVVLAYFFLIVIIDLEHHLIMHMTTLGGAFL